MGNISYLAESLTRRFATGRAYFTGTQAFPTIYGMVQCTPDLSADQCRWCLQLCANQMDMIYNGSRAGWVYGVRCNMRFEADSFFYGIPTFGLAASLPAVMAPAPPGEGNRNKVRVKVLAIAIPLVAAFVLIFIVSISYWRRRSTERLLYENNQKEITTVESLLLDLSTLRVATADFAEANKLGRGGFGTVYKGVLPNGQEIAVKRLSANSGQGIGELTNELALIAKLQHRNHVRLLGVCLEREEKLVVYEYVRNRSLDTFLFDPIKRKKLNWETRYQIIRGIARGLLYLHEDSQLKIIHRDLKTSNILLDADMNPKISDFGLARIFDTDQAQGSTKQVVGTFGYMAPEYAMRGQFSIKSDVYSFGILVLEIVTGKKSYDFFDSESSRGLASYVWEQRNKGYITLIIDPIIRDHCPRLEVLRCIEIGLLCVQENPTCRPSMSTVVLMLNSNSMLLPTPSQPAFCIKKSGILSYIYSNEVDIHGNTPYQDMSKLIPMSLNALSITEVNPR